MERVLRYLWRNCDSDNSRDKYIFGVVAGCYVSYRVVKICIHHQRRYHTRQKIKEKQEECKQSKVKLDEFLQEKGISPESVERIVGLSFNNLKKELQAGKLSAVEVLNAYQIKALEVDRLTNCMTEVIWEAEETALSRDLSNKKKGPMFGIPVSVKECYYLEGYDCTGGMAYYLDKPVKKDNVLIQVLKHQGAVPFVRTNIPQTMMTYECSNPIWGRTCNPYDTSKIPGGSSGGEGALIGGGGSILGLGSDIGGSVRIPAHMSGCCSLKPTCGRISNNGLNEFQGGQTLVSATTGPMSAEVEGLVTFMKCILVPKMFELDPTVPPIPFRNEIFEDKCRLTIGFYVDDGNIMSAPACQRAVSEVKAILEAQGHTLVPFKPVDIYRMTELFIKATFGDGGESYLDVLATDKVDSTITSTIFSFTWPKPLLKFACNLAKFITKDPMMGVFGKGFVGLKSVGEYWDLAMQIEEYKSEFLNKWRDNKLDAVICPGFAYTAIPHGKVQYCTSGVTYTILYNLLNYPAGMLNVTNVTQTDVDNFKDYPSNNLSEKLIAEYSKDSVGLPVGVQFVSLPFQEEQVLRLMKEVESILKK